jgi:diguanylate cyclase (GGDEF)-like protein/PAS domain S-box-containing protein
MAIHALSQSPAGKADLPFIAASDDDARSVSVARPRFWQIYLISGLAILGAESTAVLIYQLTTSHRNHRLGQVVIAAVALAVALVSLPLAKRIASRRWRGRYATTVSLLCGLALAVSASGDGSLSSPLLYLTVLPVMYASVGLPASAVGLCGLASLAEIAAVAAASSGEQPARDVSMLVSLVVGTAVLAFVSSLNRSRDERKDVALAAELAWMADTDVLTGCLNQRVFAESMAKEVDRALRRHRPLSLLVADVDLLKSFNDSHGHAAGDAALKAVGSVLRSQIRSFDLAARIGGDEFAVILPDTTLEDAESSAQGIAAALDGDDRAPLTLSIGVAALDPTTPTPRQLIRDADGAMYMAKLNGRRRVAVSGRPSDSSVHRNRRGEVELPRSEDRDRLEERLRRADRETTQTATILDTLMATAPVGFGYVDRDFRVVRLNVKLASINGSTIEEQVGRTVAEVVPRFWPQVEPIYRRVLDTGEAVLNVESSGKTAMDPAIERYWLISYYPVRIDSEIIGVGVVAVDITDRKQWELRQAAYTHSTVAALAATCEVRDPYTAGHQRAVAEIASAIAGELGLSAFDIEGLRLAATIHDVGKIGIPSEILNRPGQLSSAELELVRTHSQIGFDILADVDFPWPVREMVLQHHERLDGSGYPHGLRDDQILLGARIIAVADVVDAMSSHRPYRPAVGFDAAIEVIRAGRGGLFDPTVVDAAQRVLRSPSDTTGAVARPAQIGPPRVGIPW